MTIDVNELLKKQPILLFDGECGFCNRAVLFFLHHENKKIHTRPFKKMHFASLQSPEGIELKKYFELDHQIDSIILIKDHSAFIKSCAVLRLTLYMRGLWPLLSVFVIIPPFLRNIVYHFIAKRRMRLFGKVKQCELLRELDQSRFLH
ncbi:MAG: DUF393 domain-containing protein [Bacteroidota bacterium]